MIQLNKRAYAVFDNMVQLKRYYGSTKTPFLGDSFLGGGEGEQLLARQLIAIRKELPINSTCESKY
jgi:hypothetical protein